MFRLWVLSLFVGLLSICHAQISEVEQQESEPPKETILIDTRSHAEYEAGHIPNSLHIPLPELKTKSWLKGKAIKLVHSGFYPCSDGVSFLEKNGFISVECLDGGWIGWAYRHMDNKSHLSQGTLTARDILPIIQQPWVTIGYIGDRKDLLKHPEFVQIKIIRFANIEEIFNFDGLGNGGVERLIIVDDVGSVDSKVNRRIKQQKDVRFWYLLNGLESLEEQLQNSLKVATQKSTYSVSTIKQGRKASQKVRKPCGCIDD